MPAWAHNQSAVSTGPVDGVLGRQRYRGMTVIGHVACRELPSRPSAVTSAQSRVSARERHRQRRMPTCCR
jgi:hypothetical protein